MFTENEIEEIKTYLENASEDSKIYLGADSQKVKRNGIWYANFAIVLVVHIAGKHGCKIFGFKDRQRIFDAPAKQRMRLMAEVYHVVELYNKLADGLDEFANFECEIHLDVNSDPKWGSNVVMKEAMGYVLGLTSISAKIKPDAFAASYAADWLVRNN